jgi:hypothetical protein
VICERQEVERDLAAFREAKSIILSRCDEMPPERRDVFSSWAASQVVVHGLVLAIARCEGLIEDYSKYLRDLDVPDNVVELRR